MELSKKLLKNLKNQLDAGFLISDWSFEKGIYYFTLPALEYENYSMGIPESPEVKSFVESKKFKDFLMKPRKVGVALLDLIGFSSNTDDIQLKMIVRYQCEIRKTNIPCSKLISIGDGTIFIFEEPHIQDMPKYLFKIDHAIAGYNLDFGLDNVPNISHRIGVHVGKAYLFKDINGDKNYIGSGINMAQRVSTCVPDVINSDVALEANSTIYLSDEAYKEFTKTTNNEITYYDQGEREVKHGIKIRVYSMQKITKA